MLPTLDAVRYVMPLREGGSVPALVEGSDGQLWVVKLQGAGQGPLALVAELLVGELARAAGLRIPALALVTMDEALARGEPDPEIQDILRASVGVNLGLAFLPGALGFDPATRPAVPAATASGIVMLDAYASNVDRTARNPNLLWWQRELWLIDHGASLTFQHDWDGTPGPWARPFPRVRDHVLLPWATGLDPAAADLGRALTDAAIDAAAAALPAEWLPAAPREAYAAHLRARRDRLPALAEEAERARTSRV